MYIGMYRNDIIMLVHEQKINLIITTVLCILLLLWVNAMFWVCVCVFFKIIYMYIGILVNIFKKLTYYILQYVFLYYF